MKNAPRIAIYPVLGLLVTHLVACSGSSTDAEIDTVGGTPAFGGGGQGGGTPGSTSSKGGATAVGTVSTGGATATGKGGATAVGTVSTGGATATGKGGATAAGGATATGKGGATATGGTTATGKGGATAAGGTTATGKGGATATGGTTATAKGGATATGGTPGAGVDENGMPLLPQAANPINKAIDNYKKYLPGTPEGDKKWGDIVVSWQFTTGAYPKSGFDHEYLLGIATEKQRADTQAARRDLGTFDNASTITELASLGYTYKTFKDPKHQAAAQKTLDWVLSTQGSTGGFPQWYPARTGDSAYSAHATFNDEGMMRVLIALQKAVRKQDPFDSDIFTAAQLAKSKAAVEKGVEYILKSQIVSGGKLTVWCAQHNMATYKPEKAREFELPSKSGQESALIIAFLMSRHQTPEIMKAVEGGLSWYNNPEVYVADKRYVRPTKKDGSSPYVSAPGQKMWYRFYELDSNKGFFSDRDGVPLFDIQQLGEERYTGYVWAGAWGQNVLTYAAQLGMLK